MTQTSEQNQRFPLGGLERHHVGWFPITLLKRHETLEHTLDMLKADDPWGTNLNVFTGATHLYRATSDSFELLRQALMRNRDFVQVEVLHESSDLGIGYKILARNKSGESIYYDGVLYRVTEPVCEGNFEIERLNELAGYPRRADDIVITFQNSLREVITNLPEYSHTIFSFYTARHTDWNALGLQNQDNAKLRLICNDPHILTITAIIFSETGKDYDVYLGERDAILQMIAHDFCIQIELDGFINYFDKQRAEVARIKRTAATELRGIISPFYSLVRKHQQWSSVKNSLNSLLQITSDISKGELFIQALAQMVEKRWAYFNGPRQIWLEGEERDEQVQIQHPCNNFFEARLENGKLQNLSDKPSLPMYAASVEGFKEESQATSRRSGCSIRQ